MVGDRYFARSHGSPNAVFVSRDTTLRGLILLFWISVATMCRQCHQSSSRAGRLRFVLFSA